MTDSHNNFMKLALEQAEHALEMGEVPVGCVFVDNNSQVIAVGNNLTNESRNGTRHAEMVAIDKALFVDSKPPEIFADSSLYVTCEPCIMCAAALSKLKVKKVYFGCLNERFGGNGSILSIHNDNKLEHYHKYEIENGLLEKEAVDIFQKFYLSENRRAPESKRRRKNGERHQTSG